MAGDQRHGCRTPANSSPPHMLGGRRHMLARCAAVCAESHAARTTQITRCTWDEGGSAVRWRAVFNYEQQKRKQIYHMIPAIDLPQTIIVEINEIFIVPYKST